MSITRRHRLIATVGSLAALLAPLGVVAAQESASAKAPKTHSLDVYKIEQHVLLDGEFPGSDQIVTLTCDAGDYAVDGMWRVDNVDQPDPELEAPPSSKKDVYVKASYGDPNDLRQWHFSFVNEALGDAQLKVFAVCLKGQTGNNAGHSHTITVLNQAVTKIEDAMPGEKHEISASACPSGMAIAPGFNVVEGKARIAGSWPQDATSYAKWQWLFVVTEKADINLYLRCLPGKTNATTVNGVAHAHNLSASWFGGAHGADPEVGVSIAAGETERRINCADHYKAIVGSWWTWDHDKVWFLGMDPRPKQRAFRWQNDGPAHMVYNSALCLRIKTSQQVRP